MVASDSRLVLSAALIEAITESAFAAVETVAEARLVAAVETAAVLAFVVER